MDLSAYKIAMIGLGPMGRNIALNLKDKGIDVVGYDPDQEARRRADNEGIRICPSLKPDAAIEHIAGATACWIMVPDHAVDSALHEISLTLPHDGRRVIIEGGNSHFKDTERRASWAAENRYLFLGMGVSGGEEGARHGPCLMPGGDRTAYQKMRPALEAIAAKSDGTKDGGPCVAYMSHGGAGHFVKIVHNGIEYAIMQAIAETYHLLKDGLCVPAPSIFEFFAGAAIAHQTGGFLGEATAQILDTEDESRFHRSDIQHPLLVDSILDTAGQKGTGKWTSQIAYDLGVPVPSISAAINARIMSAHKKERQSIAGTVGHPIRGDTNYAWPEWLPLLDEALGAAMTAAYAQGFHLLREGSMEYNYCLNLATIAHIWQGGCIIRSNQLKGIEAHLSEHPDAHLLTRDRFQLDGSTRSLRNVLGVANHTSIPTPVLNATRDYLDTMRMADLPSASLIQAQRDYFGAHTYQRKDREGTFHTEWGEPGRPEKRVK